MPEPKEPKFEKPESKKEGEHIKLDMDLKEFDWVKTKEDLIDISEDARPAALNAIIDRNNISLTGEEKRYVLLQGIYAQFIHGEEAYTKELIIEDINDSGLEFSEDEKNKLLNREIID